MLDLLSANVLKKTMRNRAAVIPLMLSLCLVACESKHGVSVADVMRFCAYSGPSRDGIREFAATFGRDGQSAEEAAAYAREYRANFEAMWRGDGDTPSTRSRIIVNNIDLYRLDSNISISFIDITNIAQISDAGGWRDFGPPASLSSCQIRINSADRSQIFSTILSETSTIDGGVSYEASVTNNAFRVAMRGQSGFVAGAAFLGNDAFEQEIAEFNQQNSVTRLEIDPSLGPAFDTNINDVMIPSVQVTMQDLNRILNGRGDIYISFYGQAPRIQ